MRHNNEKMAIVPVVHFFPAGFVHCSKLSSWPPTPMFPLFGINRNDHKC